MKAFKTFIACAIAAIMVLSMATSAFAALAVDSVNSQSTVSASGAESVDGQRTVLVVTQPSWTGTALVANPEIVYINQVANADLGTTLDAMAGKNLTDGEYVVLVGSTTGAVESADFTAIVVKANAADGLNLSWDVTMNSALLTENGVVAQFYDKDTSEDVGEATTLTWEADVASEITGGGDFTFTAETSVSSEDYVGNTGLEISAGTVSGKN